MGYLFSGVTTVTAPSCGGVAGSGFGEAAGSVEMHSSCTEIAMSVSGCRRIDRAQEQQVRGVGAQGEGAQRGCSSHTGGTQLGGGIAGAYISRPTRACSVFGIGHVRLRGVIVPMACGSFKGQTRELELAPGASREYFDVYCVR